MISTQDGVCVCNCYDAISNGTNSLYVELEATNTTPQLNIYLGDTLKESVELVTGLKNTVNIPSDYFTANSELKLQYVDSKYTGEYFVLTFPNTLEGNMTLKQTGAHTFDVQFTTRTEVSSVNVVDTLSSTSTTDALSANQGRVLGNRINSLSTRISSAESEIDIVNNYHTYGTSYNSPIKVGKVGNYPLYRVRKSMTVPAGTNDNAFHYYSHGISNVRDIWLDRTWSRTIVTGSTIYPIDSMFNMVHLTGVAVGFRQNGLTNYELTLDLYIYYTLTTD